MKKTWFVLLTVLTMSNVALSQKNFSGTDGQSFIKNVSLKAGVDVYSFSNRNLHFYSLTDNVSFWGSAAYDCSKKVQLEILYEYSGEKIFGYISIVKNNYPNYYSYAKFDRYYSSNVYFKTNYFLNKNRTIIPIYFTGSLIFSIQKVINAESSFSNIYDSTTHFWNESFAGNVSSTYNRMLIGTSVGFGLYLALGHINFQTELSFSAKVAPFVNRGFREYTFNLSFAPVYKF